MSFRDRCRNSCPGCFNGVSIFLGPIWFCRMCRCWSKKTDKFFDYTKFPTTLGFMILYVVWCAFVLKTGIKDTNPDVSQTFNVVGATLAFILPLIAASAVARNKEALNNYNAFCGDVLALGWEVLAYVRDEKSNAISENDKMKIKDLFEICLVLPTLVKWKFRQGLDIEKVYLVKFGEDIKQVFGFDNLEYNAVEGKFKGKFIDTSVGGRFNQIFGKVKKRKTNDKGEDIKNVKGEPIMEKGIDECDLMFALLNTIISEFDTNGDTRKNMLQRTLERVYNSYGNMGNINAYQLPQVYKVYLYISMFIFIGLFPLNYETKGGKLKAMNVTTEGDFEALYSDEYSSILEHEWNIIWHGVVLVYFLFGFNFMTTRVGNAFNSQKDSPGYTTVGKSETEVNNGLLALYKAKQDFQGIFKLGLLDRRMGKDLFISKKGLMNDRRAYDQEFDQYKDWFDKESLKDKTKQRKAKQKGIERSSGGESKSKSLTNRRKLYV